MGNDEVTCFAYARNTETLSGTSCYEVISVHELGIVKERTMNREKKARRAKKFYNSGLVHPATGVTNGNVYVGDYVLVLEHYVLPLPLCPDWFCSFLKFCGCTVGISQTHAEDGKTINYFTW